MISILFILHWCFKLITIKQVFIEATLQTLLMEGEKSQEKISLQDMKTYDDQLFSTGETELFGEDSGRRCNCSPFSKRYMISILALLGFCNVYALRVNLSVALVAMVAKSWTLDKEGRKVEVSMNNLEYIHILWKKIDQFYYITLNLGLVWTKE